MKNCAVSSVVLEGQQVILSGVNSFKEACTLVITSHLLPLNKCKRFSLSDDSIPERFLYVKPYILTLAFLERGWTPDVKKLCSSLYFQIL